MILEQGSTMTVHVSNPNMMVVGTSRFEAKPTEKELRSVTDFLWEIVEALKKHDTTN